MLNFFSKRMSNFGFLLIGLSLLVFQIFSATYPVDIDIWQKSAPLAKVVFELLGAKFFQNQFIDFALSTPLVLFQLLLIYNLISRIKNLEKYSLLITWFYCWLIHLFPAWTKFSPPLIASSILIFVLYRLYKEVEAKDNQFIFTISTLIGISFLFWYPSIFLLAFLLTLLFQYNSWSIKRFMIVVLSFSIPLIWFCIYRLAMYDGLDLIYKFSTFHITKIQFEKFGALQAIPIFTISIAILIGGFQTMALSTKTAKMSRLFINSQLGLILFLSIAFILSINRFTYSFIFLLFPFSMFLVMFINIFKLQIIAELAHIMLLLAVIFNFVYLY